MKKGLDFAFSSTGSESSARQYCPPSLLAKMDYTYTGRDTTVACDSSADNWDVCTDRMIMNFNYTTCSQKMAYSGISQKYSIVIICARIPSKLLIQKIMQLKDIMCLSIGTPKNNKFSICSKWKIYYFKMSQN